MLGAAALLVSNGTASAASKCTAGRIAAAGKKASGILKCHAKAEAKGAALDLNCVGKAVAKYNSDMGKATGKGDCVNAGLPNVVDATIEAKVDAFVNSVVAEIDPGFPAPAQSKCSSGEKKCVGKKAQSKAKCYQKAQLKGLPVDPACLTAAETKYGPCMSKAIGKADCLSGVTAATLEAKVDDFIRDLFGELVPNCGDGVQALTENCDDGNNANCDGCKGDCSRPDKVCGDTIQECAEACDDGNIVNCDGCHGDCTRLDNLCGDGIPECGEVCDDGNTTSCVPYPGCNATCSANQFCGDGLVNCGDVCDPPGSPYLTGLCNGTCSGSPSGAFLN